MSRTLRSRQICSLLVFVGTARGLLANLFVFVVIAAKVAIKSFHAVSGFARSWQ